MRKRNNLIQIWLSDDELEKLSTQAAKCGLSRAAFLRQLICGFQPKELPPPGLLSDDAAALLLWE